MRYCSVFILVTASQVVSGQIVTGHGTKGPATELPSLVPGIDSLKLSSLDGDVFAFQLHTFLKSQFRYTRWWLSSDGSPCAVNFVGGRHPALFHLPLENIAIRKEGVLRERFPRPWSFSIKQLGMNSGTGDPPDTPDKGSTSFITLDLSNCLTFLDRVPASEVGFTRQSQVQRYLLDSGQGLIFEFRARTPTDTLQLGSALGSWRARRGDYEIRVNALTVNSHFDTFGSVAALDIDAKDVDRLPPTEYDGLKGMPERVRFGYRTWSSLSSVTSLDGFVDKRQQRSEIRKLETDVIKEGGVSFNRRWIRQFCTLCRLLREYATDPGDDGSRLPIDDVDVRWSRLEQFLEFKPAFVVSMMVPTIVSNLRVTLEDRIRIVHACSELGELPDPTRMALLDAEDGPLYRAILKAHHRHPWTEEDVRECHRYLDQLAGGSPAALALTQSLIMMDEIDRIPPDRVDQWYATTIHFGQKQDRLEALRQLTLLPSGRSWLKNRLKTDDRDPVDLKFLELSALRQRAEATQKTKLWDFMSEEECRQTLAFVAGQHAQLRNADKSR